MIPTMEDVLWYLFASSRGGPTRVEIVRELEERPRNANELAERLEYDYTTVRHHLSVLVENNVLKAAGSGYGDVYLFTDAVKSNWNIMQEILATVGGDRR